MHGVTSLHIPTTRDMLRIVYFVYCSDSIRGMASLPRMGGVCWCMEVVTSWCLWHRVYLFSETFLINIFLVSTTW